MNTNHSRINWALRSLWALVIVGALASFVSASHRWGVERDNRRVEIAVDLNELRTIAAAEPQYGFPDVLAKFRAAGVTSVAIEEDTIGGLEQSRRLTIVPSADRATTTLQPLTADSYNRIAAALQFKTGFAVEAKVDATAIGVGTSPRRSHRRHPVTSATPEPVIGGGPAPGLIVVHQPINVVRAVGIGLDPMLVQTVQSAGLQIVGRVSNFTGVTPDAIDWTLDRLHDARVSTIIFTGEEVLGYNGPLPPNVPAANLVHVAEGLARDGLNYGAVEFGKQQGDPALQRKAAANMVRVHTILGTEMVAADIPANVQRFLLAARERNIRVLFVRLFTSEPGPVEANTDYIKQIAHGLEHARPTHLELGVAHGYKPLRTGRPLRFLIGLGVAAAWLLLFDALTRVFASKAGLARALIFPGLVALALIALAVVGGASSLIGVKIVALAAGCIYPSLGLLYHDQLRSNNDTSPLIVALKRFTLACAATALGILAIVGLLSDRLFLIKADEFLGVKMVAIAPTLLVALIYGLSLRATEHRSLSDAIDRSLNNLRRWFSEPINLGQVLIAVIALAAIGIIVTRSGNDSAVGVSSLELKLRSILDLIMPARPRFKDMLGHPALLIAFTLAARGYRKWAFPFLLLGAVGLSSMLDAFCHLHTPLLVAITRDIIAIVFGLLLFCGILYPFRLRPLLKRVSPAPAAVD